jgi:hypothetical protein
MRQQGKTGFHLFGYGTGTAAGGIDKNPIGFASGQYFAILFSEKPILAEGTHFAKIHHPGKGNYVLTGICGAEIIDFV